MNPDLEARPEAPSGATIGAGRPRPAWTERAVALLEVILCSGYPTQLAIGATLRMLGYTMTEPSGRLSVAFVVALELADTVVLVGLILLFLHAHGERPRNLFLGARSVQREAVLGLPLTFAALMLALGVLLAIQLAAPWLRTEARNPLLDLLDTTVGVTLFGLVVVVAGGTREEIQRAFVLTRFEQWLGGASLGLLVGSLAFGAGHWLQGADAAIATAALGAFWGLVYLKRRSIVAPVVSHSLFNLLQITQALIVRTGT